MIPFVRRQKILEILHKSEVAYLDELIKETGASEATIRRDLKTLNEEDQIDLLLGGAAKIRVHLSEEPLNKRVFTNKEEKELIGKYAATLINDGDFIYIGPGTTENTIIQHLAEKNVTVVTTGTFHINALIENKIDCIILGGRMIHSIAVLSGPMAIEQVKNMHFDKCFIGCSGLSFEGKLTTSDENVAAMNKEVIKTAKTVYFLADSTKFGKANRFEFAATQNDHYLITTKKQDEFIGECKLIITD